MASNESGATAGDIAAMEAELRRLRAAHAFLLSELQNRVRNVLATIRSVTRRSAELCESPDDLIAHLDGRLGALARAQSLLLRDPSMPQDLALLVSGELFAYRVQEGKQLSITGPSVRVRPSAVMTLVLAFHELATNALKFGALSQSKGHVAVGWRVTREGPDAAAQLVIDWCETDGPLLSNRPEHRGFGTELLEQSLPYEMHAAVALTYAPNGLRCTLRLPEPVWMADERSGVEEDAP